MGFTASLVLIITSNNYTTFWYRISKFKNTKLYGFLFSGGWDGDKERSRQVQSVETLWQNRSGRIENLINRPTRLKRKVKRIYLVDYYAHCWPWLAGPNQLMKQNAFYFKLRIMNIFILNSFIKLNMVYQGFV